MATPKQNLFEKAVKTFDLPSDVMVDLPRIEITGCREMLIENHKGILEYGEEQIDINCGRVIVKIHGVNLELKAMNQNELKMAGTILSVEFAF